MRIRYVFDTYLIRIIFEFNKTMVRQRYDKGKTEVWIRYFKGKSKIRSEYFNQRVNSFRILNIFAWYLFHCCTPDAQILNQSGF